MFYVHEVRNCCVLAIFECRRGRLRSKISGGGQLAEVTVYFAMSGLLPNNRTSSEPDRMSQTCRGRHSSLPYSSRARGTLFDRRVHSNYRRARSRRPLTRCLAPGQSSGSPDVHPPRLGGTRPCGMNSAASTRFRVPVGSSRSDPSR